MKLLKLHNERGRKSFFFFFNKLNECLKQKKIQVKQPVLKNKNLFNFLNLKNIFWVANF